MAFRNARYIGAIAFFISVLVSAPASAQTADEILDPNKHVLRSTIQVNLTQGIDEASGKVIRLRKKLLARISRTR